MSFGFGVGDFITVLQLVRKVRKEYADAPSDFNAISTELRSFSIVLEDVDVLLSGPELSAQQKLNLQEIAKGSYDVLTDLQKRLDKYSDLKPSKSVDGKMKRAWKRFTWDPKDIQDLRDRIVANITLLSTFQMGVSRQANMATKDGVDKLHERQDDRERREECEVILNWLTPIDYFTQQSDFISRRQEGTGQWLVKSTEYQSWLDAPKETLFCPGIPGAGKTILSSIVVEDLTTRFSNDPTVGVAYIYCNFRRQDEQKITDLLASLLKQLAETQTSLPGIVKELYNQHKGKGTRPSADDICKYLQAVTQLYSRVYFVVDALDECQQSDQCRSNFVSRILNLQAQSEVNLFTTSRFIPEITEKFNQSKHLEIRASTEDVQRYLHSHMSQLPAFVSRNLKLQEEVTTEIAKAVDGMFLLAQLYLKSLEDKTSPKAMRTALKQFQQKSQKEGLSEDRKLEVLSLAYDEAMERINKQQAGFQEVAKNVLSWITCAKRPLTTSELQHALAVEADETELDEDNLTEITDMVSVCAGLVTFDEESNIIRLVHYTTQEYFNRTKERWFPDVETEITKTCVTYLSFETFNTGPCPTDKEFEARLQENTLYSYASRNWGHHCRAASGVIQEVFDFAERRSHVDASVQALTVETPTFNGVSQYFPEDMTLLHLAAYFEIIDMLQVLLDKGLDVSVTDKWNRTPLIIASEDGHLEVVRLLLEKGADVLRANDYGETPLFKASRYGHREVIRLLLEKGADVLRANDYGETPLFKASRYGHLEVIRLLLEKGADVSRANYRDETPLFIASKNGYREVIRLLLEKGADPTRVDYKGQSALDHAAIYGHLEIVRLLLKEGVDLTRVDNEGQSALDHAAKGGHLEIVRLLLKEGVDLTRVDNEGQSALDHAAIYGRLEVVRLLLENGADPTRVDKEGHSALDRAATYGQLEVVRLLLEKGADPTRVDKEGHSALDRAATYGQLETVKLLTEWPIQKSLAIRSRESSVTTLEELA